MTPTDPPADHVARLLDDMKTTLGLLAYFTSRSESRYSDDWPPSYARKRVLQNVETAALQDARWLVETLTDRYGRNPWSPT